MGVPSEELMNMIKSQRDSATPNGIPDVPTGAGEMGISDPNSPRGLLGSEIPISPAPVGTSGIPLGVALSR